MQRSGGWRVDGGTFSRCKPEEQRQIRRLQLKKYLEFLKKYLSYMFLWSLSECLCAAVRWHFECLSEHPRKEKKKKKHQEAENNQRSLERIKTGPLISLHW